MDQQNPIALLGLLVVSAAVCRWWLADWRAARAGQAPAAGALPGASDASARAIALAAGGGLLLVAAETAGEYALGITGEQSHMTALFGFYTLAAAFVEELIFRGFLVVENRGRGALLAGVIGASLLFALLHPFLWEWKDGSLLWDTGAKAWFSTAVVFVSSLWFYTVRFWPLNPSRSLWPCIAAHAAKNLAVFGVKLAQGFVGSWW